MSSPFFSIIIPAYNVEKYIEKTLDSLEIQSYKSVEIIIINDGSTDNTLTVIEKKSAVTSFKYKILNQKNSGVSVARNNGMLKAEGRFIIFLDGDDYVEENYLQIFHDTLIDTESELAICKYKKVDEQYTVLPNKYPLSLKIKSVNSSQCLMIEYMKSNDIIMTGCIAYKKELLLENGIKFPTGQAYGEDQEFIIKAIYKSQRIAFINLFLLSYLQRKSSAVGTCNPYKLRDNIKAYANLKRYFQTQNHPEYCQIIRDFKIPQNILFILKSYSRHGFFDEYMRLLAKKNYRKSLAAGLFAGWFSCKTRILLIMLLLFPKFSYKILLNK